MKPCEWFAWHTNAFARFYKEAMKATGTVKFFNAQKGFGFIVQDHGGPDPDQSTILRVESSSTDASRLRGDCQLPTLLRSRMCQ
jgi:hypothetical protein